MLDIVYWQSFN